ncbi:hypothetical protein VKT23_016954 [Stygiomarasmius scandens]|uniref:Uncharacterized protein n=1 Tax=Marasmiellus scandens TaxID=2682957 RepID=A0ABR1ITL9_9AGAR
MFRYGSFFFVLFCHAFAFPIEQSGLSESYNTDANSTAACVDSDPDDTKRSTQDIVWSCIATIFACTWVSIHPNIPGLNVGRLTKFFRRVGVTMLALLAPELIVIWALRQWLVSRRLAKEYADLGWQQVHGFFVIMGGFMLYDGNNPTTVILPDQLPSFRERCELRIVSEEIWDKSKGDLLSKGLVLLQVTWFIIQCIARACQNLAITQLETMTLAFATLNFVTYTLWWNKPLGVDYPVSVCRGSGQKRSVVTEVQGDVFQVSDMCAVVIQSLRNFLGVPSGQRAPILPSPGHNINRAIGLGLIGHLVMGLDDVVFELEVLVSTISFLQTRDSSSISTSVPADHLFTARSDAMIAPGCSSLLSISGEILADLEDIPAVDVQHYQQEAFPSTYEFPVEANDSYTENISPAFPETDHEDLDPREPRDDYSSSGADNNENNIISASPETDVKNLDPGLLTDDSSSFSAGVDNDSQTNNIALFRVPTFYSGWCRPGNGDLFHLLSLKNIAYSPALLAVPIAAVFGAIHCIAWSSAFATDAEQRLWHISSILIHSPIIYFAAAQSSSDLTCTVGAAFIYRSQNFHNSRGIYLSSGLTLECVSNSSLDFIPAAYITSYQFDTYGQYSTTHFRIFFGKMDIMQRIIVVHE